MNHEKHTTKIIKLDLKLQCSMLRSSLYDYSDVYILVKGTITAKPVMAARPNNANKKVIFKNWVPFTNFISRISNTQVDDVHDIHVEMLMYNLIEYSDSYSKASAILWKYCRHQAAYKRIMLLLI